MKQVNLFIFSNDCDNNVQLYNVDSDTININDLTHLDLYKSLDINLQQILIFFMCK